jgi:hypothetical protein
MNDVPVAYSATAANYCVWNPLATGSGKVLVNGNLEFTSSANGWYFTLGTIGVSSGKYYWEVNMGSSAGSDIFAGIMGSGMPTGTAAQGLQDNVSLLNTYGSLLFCDDGKYQLDGNTSRVAYSTALTSNQTLGIAVDMDAKSLTFYKDGVSQGAISFSSSPMATSIVCPAFSSYYSSDSNRVFNFGQRAFTYTPPSGYNALNTYNLPMPSIAQGNKYMDATTFTGVTGAIAVMNAGSFQPDLVWVKSRSNTQDNYLVDSNRGGNYLLRSSTSGAESVYASPNWITSFNPNGFSSSSDSLLSINYSYVAWQWQAGKGSNVSNTNGSITSIVSASTTAGFSIVTFNAGTGSSAQTVGHGLGVAPSLIFFKDRTNAYPFYVYHSSGTTQNQYLNLTTTAAVGNQSGFWGSSLPTSSVFGFTCNNTVAGSANVVAYCFAPVAGFSAFGSYTGNGSADGPFVYCGFRPAFVMIKASSSTSDWWITDTARNPSNVTNYGLRANTSQTEVTDVGQNILSNGFKYKNDTGAPNISGVTYIFIAFAANPFKYSNAF